MRVYTLYAFIRKTLIRDLYMGKYYELSQFAKKNINIQFKKNDKNLKRHLSKDMDSK